MNNFHSKEVTILSYIKTGLSHSRIDNIYKSIIQRCYNKSHNRYYIYGARGIVMCDEWLHDKSKFFEWSLANGYDDTLTIDRIDCNGNYEPNNCRWVSQKVQQNNRSNNRRIEFNGECHTMAEWANITGINAATIHARLKRGWDIEKTITTEV